eukprot:TRINITY_DN1823_c0_g1_i1.p1 TRINITY_DN1823_c0_g1~~TRINITY_DN1823_c0_g1_i1.p1  ORF type:complete len:476 (-),score=83.04 TRINITY_DN1823_c0_g1_i1:193-1620(-)
MKTMLVIRVLLLALSCITNVGFSFSDKNYKISHKLRASYGVSSSSDQQECKQNGARPLRPHSVSITEFGAVGDGATLNTVAFRNAIFYVNSLAEKGGAQLYVPAGKWLTGSFNLTSHLTLYLEAGAEILGSQDIKDWPVIDPLPSYGRGRELPGGRHCSLIHGQNLTDVVITGENGTINGQGALWWQSFRNKTLDFTRPSLVELINSNDIIISNLTFIDSPFWTVHPVYCRNVRINKMTILAPLNSPNTDGIDPDSCNDVCIEDCYVSVGDDVISIKSGWDEYGISYGHPSSNIIIRRIIGQTHTSSGLAIGSEMSGGVRQVHAYDLQFFNSRRGLRIKTSTGRGGYVAGIYINNVTMSNVSCGICFTGAYGDHPDDKYDPNALPKIEKITFRDITGDQIKQAGTWEGIEKAPFRDICMSNVFFNVTDEPAWNCTFVLGFSDTVYPQPCHEVQAPYPYNSSICYSSSVNGACGDH